MKMQYARRFSFGRCLVLLSVYMLGMVLGSAIMLSLDVSRVILEPVRTARDTIPGFSQDNREHMSLHRKHLNTLSLDDSVTYNDQSLHGKSLFVSIIPSNLSHFDNIYSIYNTWASTLTNIAIFLSNTTNTSLFYEDSTFIPELQSTMPYPSLNEIVQVLQYLYEHTKNYEYFLLVSDLAYINIHSFHDMLNAVTRAHSNGEEPLYAGRPKTYGLNQFCMANSGILLNIKALTKLIESINDCTGWSKRYSWDTMLGQCVRKTLGIRCLNISQYFVHDDQYLSLSPINLWSPAGTIYSSAFSISPVVTYEHMNILHYYYSSIQMKKYLARAEDLRKSVLYSCEALSSYAFDHQTVTKDCEVAAKEKDTPLYLRYRKKETRKWGRYHQPPSWKYFDDKYIYADDRTEPCVKHSEDRQTSFDIEVISSIAETVVQERYKLSNLRLNTIINGYLRPDLAGNEFIIDAKYNNTDVIVNERVRLLRPFMPNVKVQPNKDSLEEVVHVIVPISKSNSKCIKFLQQYIKKSLKQSVHLRLVVYKKSDFESMKEKVNKIKAKYKMAAITVIKGKGRFSRAKALHQGMATLSRSDLAFFCDVDMIIEPHFFDRCRRNTIRGSQVYFPTVVKLYNPKLYKNVHRSSSLPLNRQTGHWASYGYGMVCLYKSDYLYAGGLNIRMRGWGGEDLDFFERVKNKGLTSFRAPDKGLIHHWHERDCSSRSVRRHMKIHCESSKVEALGDRRTLARYIFNLTDNNPSLLL